MLSPAHLFCASSEHTLRLETIDGICNALAANANLTNPRPTASGKFEIYCQALADAVNNAGWSTIKPYPTHIVLAFGRK